MAIKHELSVPTELPAAYLYLDDVQDIVRVLEDANSVLPEYRRKTLTFTFGGTKGESIEDLKEIGGAKREIEIGDHSLSVRIHALTSQARLGALDGDAEWATFA